MSALQDECERVQSMAAYVSLKRTELCPDHHISLVGLMNAQVELNIARSLLGGRAFMIQDMVARKKVALDRKARQILQKVMNYTRTPA